MNYSVWKNTVSICLLFKGGDGDDMSPAGTSGEASAEKLAEGTESFLEQQHASCRHNTNRHCHLT